MPPLQSTKIVNNSKPNQKPNPNKLDSVYENKPKTGATRAEDKNSEQLET